MLGEELPERLFSACCVLGQHTLAGHLRDVRGFEVDLQGEAVHEARQLDPLVVEAVRRAR